MDLLSTCPSQVLPWRPRKIMVFITSFGKESHSFPTWDNHEVRRQDRPIVPTWMGRGPRWPRGWQLWEQPRTVTPLLNKRALQTRVAPTAPPVGTALWLAMALRSCLGIVGRVGMSQISVGPLSGSQHGQVSSSVWGCSQVLFNLQKEVQPWCLQWDVWITITGLFLDWHF